MDKIKVQKPFQYQSEMHKKLSKNNPEKYAVELAMHGLSMGRYQINDMWVKGEIPEECRDKFTKAIKELHVKIGEDYGI